MLTCRAEAHTLRFAIIYALLDHSDRIGVLHLKAALCSGITACDLPPTFSATDWVTRTRKRSWKRFQVHSRRDDA